MSEYSMEPPEWYPDDDDDDATEETDGIPDYHIQFCDREANQDITSSHYAEQDATEIRLWSADSTCIVAIELNKRSKRWHVSGSDVYNWSPRSRAAFQDWKDAMLWAPRWHQTKELSDMLRKAGYPCDGQRAR